MSIETIRMTYTLKCPGNRPPTVEVFRKQPYRKVMEQATAMAGNAYVCGVYLELLVEDEWWPLQTCNSTLAEIIVHRRVKERDATDRVHLFRLV